VALRSSSLPPRILIRRWIVATTFDFCCRLIRTLSSHRDRVNIKLKAGEAFDI
jgi:hypothetical protein